MALNKFTVFGINQAVYSTEDTNTTRKDLFEKGLEANKTAKSNDVNTVLKETSLVTVSILDWIKDKAVSDFSTPAENQTSVNNFILNVNTSLNSKIKELVETYIPKITATNRGGAKLLTNALQTVVPNDVTATPSRSYAVQLNGNEQLVVNIPWTDTLYSAGTGISLDAENKFNINLGYVASGRNYAIQNGSGGLFVNIPWTDTTAITSANSTGTDVKITYLLNAESNDIKTAKYTKFEVSAPLKRTLTAGVMTISADLVTATASGIVPHPNSGTNVIFGVGNTVGSPSWTKVTKDMISGTGTPSATTFYRGDGAWATPIDTKYTSGTGITVDGTNKINIDTTYIGSIKKTSGTEKFVREDGSLVIPPMNTGPQGYTFTPSVDVNGLLSWTNNGGLANPTSVNIKGGKGDQGIKGDKGDKGDRGEQGYIFTPSVTLEGLLSWTNNGNLTNPTSVNIKGPKGDKGEKGDQGIQGLQGIKGDKGDQGIQGIQGIQGVKGDKGDPGVTFNYSNGVLTITKN